MKKKYTIAFIGCGSLVLALAPQLQQAGYAVEEIVVRDRPAARRRAAQLARRVGARVSSFDEAALAADLLWFGVSDSAIAQCAAQLSVRRKSWKGTLVLHSSGALTSDALAPFTARGAGVASLHPMMTFVRTSAPPLAGVGFAAEGAPRALTATKAIVRDLGGRWFRIARQAKTLYHAWGAFSSPLLIMELALAESVARGAGIAAPAARRIMEPIVRRTIDNYFARGAAASFSGPLVRGDVATIVQHLAALKRIPGARDVYRALAHSALLTLPVGERAALRRLLKK
jgi:predicted short-subunit dehydrogenase-like oxidoreductase (DUF2520 family)